MESSIMAKKDLKRAPLIETYIKRKCTVKQVTDTLVLSERRAKQIKKHSKKHSIKSIFLYIIHNYYYKVTK